MLISLFLVLEQALSCCPTVQYDSCRVPGIVPSVMSQEQQKNSFVLHDFFFHFRATKANNFFKIYLPNISPSKLLEPTVAMGENKSETEVGKETEYFCHCNQ